MKKIIALVLLAATMLLLAVPAYAAARPEEPGIRPLYNYTSENTVSLSISSSGKATCLADVWGYSHLATKVSITMTLQKKTLFWWSKVESWTVTANTYHADMYESVYVSSGTYRVKAEFTVYSGSSKEEITSCSKDVKY